MMASDPAYAADVVAKGGVWMIAFPSEDIPVLLAEAENPEQWEL